MLFGINGGELLIILLLIALVVGPERLPEYARQLGDWVRRLRDLTQDAKSMVKEELGDEADSFDWRSLDPRQYDPRKIVADALREPAKPRTRPAAASSAPALPTGSGAAGAAESGAAASAAAASTAASAPAPFDDEAT